MRSICGFSSKLIFRFSQYLQLIRLDKPVGIFLLLWPTLIALWIASEGIPSFALLRIFFFGTILMRSAGCAINDYADRDFDVHVKRTANRPLARGTISGKESILISILFFLLASFLIISLNRLIKFLAFVSLFLAISYPYMKRFFSVPQSYLGVAFSFGTLMAFAAVKNQLSWVSWMLFIANVFWTIAYDTEYALVDREDDLKIGIKTAAITFGFWDIYVIGLCYLFFLLIYAYIGTIFEWSMYFWMAWVLVSSLILYDFFLIRDRRPSYCFAAFQHNQWIGLILFLGVIAHYSC